MKTKSKLAIITIATMTAVPAILARPDGKNSETFKVDAVHSAILFRVTHMGVGPFWGRFSTVGGSIELIDGGKDLKLNLEVPIEGIDSGSSNLDGHLKGPDFFAAEEHPIATFVSTKVKGNNKGKFKVTGDLTIRGVTKAIEVEVVLTGPVDTRYGKRCGLETEFKIKRSEFGINYGVENGALGDDTRLIVGLEAVSAPEKPSEE